MPSVGRIVEGWGVVLAALFVALLLQAEPLATAKMAVFKSSECGVSFRYPAGWQVVRPTGASIGKCALEIRPPRPETEPDKLRAELVWVAVYVQGLGIDRALRETWTNEQGKWLRGALPTPAEDIRRNGWRGVRQWITTSCQDEEWGSVTCSVPVATVGTSRRSAEIEGQPESEVAFEAILRDFAFLGDDKGSE